MSWRKGIAVFRYLSRNEVLGAVIIVWSFAIPVRAGDYHTVGTSSLVCSDCHTIHYAQLGTRSEAGGPWQRLLLYSAINGLCLSCHDGQTSVPDVLQGHSGSHIRTAGAFQALSGSSTPNGHNLGVAGTPPGGVGSMTLTCTSCHDPHGNANYRNLKTSVGSGGAAITYSAGGANDLAKWVWEVATTPMATHYDVSNIRYNEPVTTDSAFSGWCGGCHGNFHGLTNTGDPEPWTRHPTAKANISSAPTAKTDYSYWSNAARLSRVPVMSAIGTIPLDNDNTPSCMTCHKAHGASNKYGLIFDNPATTALEDGTSILQTCQQCHNQ